MRASAQVDSPSRVAGAARAPDGSPRDRRLAVSAITSARTPVGERTVRIVGLSAKTAELLSPEPLGWAGQTLDLDVPNVGGRDLVVMAGIVGVDETGEGQLTVVEFVVIDREVRRQLNELLVLLLAGEPDADARRPRVVYDTMITYGPLRHGRAYLQEVSLTGLSMRVGQRMAHDLLLEVTLPPFRDGEPIELRGRVTGQRLSPEGGYITTLDFEPLDRTRRTALGTLIADLMCR